MAISNISKRQKNHGYKKIKIKKPNQNHSYMKNFENTNTSLHTLHGNLLFQQNKNEARYL